MDFFVNWLNTITPSAAAFFGTLVSVSGAMIVATLAFIGVMRQIRHENRRFEKRLKHEAEQNTIERAMEMKRDVFMTVCEGMAAGVRYLAKFADVTLPPDKHEEIISQVLPKTSPVHIIASDATLDTLIRTYECFVESVFELHFRRLPITNKLGELGRFEAMLNQRQQLREQLQAKLHEVRGLAPSPSLDNFLVERLTVVESEIKAVETKCAELHPELFRMRLELASLALQRSQDFEKFQAKAIIAMRAELSFPIDTARYEQNLNGVRARVWKNYEEFVENVKTTVKFGEDSKQS
jgi:hypothetical protein